jgi:ubiquinone/menaquinone biosynthesis C-methylase UbiE
LEHREYFNKIAHKWDEICSHDTAKLKAITKMADISKGQRVLDVGTGTGVMLPFIHKLVGDEGEITAIDLAEKMLEVAKQKYPFDNIRFIFGDIATAALPKIYYDVIMCYSVFPHFKDKPQIISHMAGLLKSRGRLVIAHSQSRNAINSLHAKLDAVREDQLPEAVTIEKYLKQAELEPILTEDNDEMFVVIGQKNFKS